MEDVLDMRRLRQDGNGDLLILLLISKCRQVKISIRQVIEARCQRIGFRY